MAAPAPTLPIRERGIDILERFCGAGGQPCSWLGSGHGGGGGGVSGSYARSWSRSTMRLGGDSGVRELSLAEHSNARTLKKRRD